MFHLVLTFHLILCVFLVIVVLLQQGKGADAGATFGGGSNTLFGASGASTILTKITTGGAVLFMITSIMLVKMYPEGIAAGGTTKDLLKGSVMNVNVDSAAGNDVAGNGAAPGQKAKEGSAKKGEK
ncbi:MAG: preprotein translocase subunit SecG [Candidatus Dadabacteria bacterium]|nr:MAG: preprotein translocase subunit SecG [Candidatus Dadabacteria bacterium]